MSKQMYFYATESDNVVISNILHRVFGELIEVPRIKSEFLPFNIQTEKRKFYLAEKKSENNIVYRISERYDGSTSEILDSFESPVMECDLSAKNERGYYTEGRFYCCSDDKEFSKKVSSFFTKLKKEFWYAKKWKSYISKNIDIENASFLVPNRVLKISKDELS